MFKVVFIKASGQKRIEFLDSIKGAKARAAEMGWVLKSLCLNIQGDEI